MNVFNPKRLVVFVSGDGTNFKQIFSEIQSGNIRAEIVSLISNNPQCKAVDYAQKQNIPVAIINNKFSHQSKDYSDAILTQLDNLQPDLLILAGFMKKIPNAVVQKYNRKIINIHPALLPLFGGKGFYGKKVHQAVLEAGVKISGPTVHFVNEEYDKGQIIAQKSININHDDNVESLASKVLIEEHKLYPSVVKAFCENRIIWKNEKPWIIEPNIVSV